MNQSQFHAQEKHAVPRKASAIQVAKAVFFSFFGVRKRQDYESDAAKITLLQIVVAGFIGVAIFIAGLLSLVAAVTK